MSHELVERYADLFPGLLSKEWVLHGIGAMVPAEPQFPPKEHAHRWQRMRYVMEQEGLDYQTLAQKIGLDISTTYRIIQGKSRPQNSTLRQLRAAFPQYREQWLMIGQEPIHAEAPQDSDSTDLLPIISALASKDFPHSNAAPFTLQATMPIPVIEDPAAAGGLTGYGDPVRMEDLRILNVPVDRIHSGEYRIFTVRGVSMDDGSLMSLADGDLVLARQVHRDYWWDGLHTRTWLYFIFVTLEQGIIVKSVAEQDFERRTFTLRSLNPDFADLIVHDSEVVAIYNVIKVIERELRR